MKLIEIILVLTLFISCTEQAPTVSPVAVQPAPVVDTVRVIDTFEIVSRETLTDTVILEITDTLYLRDTTNFKAIDLLTVGYQFAKRVLTDSSNNPGTIYFDTLGICDWQAQINSSYGCEFYKVRGKLYVRGGGNITKGLKYFTAWIRYDGDGPMSDSANWELFDMEWR